MSRPVVGSVAERLYAKALPLAYKDEELDWPLLRFCAALGEMLQEVDDIVSDTDEHDGWTSIFDLERAPEKALGYLAQFVGVGLRPGLSDAEQRARIAATDGFRRGSPEAFKAAAKQYLDGDKNVILNEREGSAYRIGLLTFDTETPDEDAVREALREQKPGGIVLDYFVIGYWIFVAVRTAYDSYSEVRATYTTFDHLRLNIVGGSSYTAILDSYADYDALDADFTTYDELESELG